MSRLDSAIRRLQAQRACLDHAVTLTRDQTGVAVEFGLGNGRTYDHLREILAGREIFVFDRQVASHPDSTPDQDHLILGDLPDSIAPALPSLPGPVVLCHIDIGRGVKTEDEALATAIGTAVRSALAADAILLSDQALAMEGLEILPLPEGVKPGRYHLYRAAPARPS